jgi:hypothetical protein
MHIYIYVSRSSYKTNFFFDNPDTLNDVLNVRRKLRLEKIESTFTLCIYPKTFNEILGILQNLQYWIFSVSFLSHMSHNNMGHEVPMLNFICKSSKYKRLRVFTSSL